MNTPEANQSTQTSNAINLSVRLLAIALLFYSCFHIVEPFLTVIVWSVVLAVTLYPFHQRVSNIIGKRSILAACIIVLLLLLIMVVPAVYFLLSSGGEVKELATQYREGLLTIPAPSEDVKSWPLIGSKVYDLWTQASTDLGKVVSENSDSLKTIIIKLFALLASAGKGILFLAASIIISGVFLCYADSSAKAAKTLFTRLAGATGESMASIAEVTIRNVAKGILGVAFIQSTLAGIGFVVVGLPAAGLWVLICLILSIIQIGIVPVSIGSIIYVWSVANTLTATLFTIWMLLVGVSDNILKPIMLGKNAPVPMLAVLMGSIGGFIHSGLIGLFTGAIILSLGYKLYEGWVNESTAA